MHTNIPEGIQCLRPVLRCLAEFGDALEFAQEETSFEIERVVIERAAKIGRLDNEVMNDGPFLTGSVPKQASPSLHELPRIGRTC